MLPYEKRWNISSSATEGKDKQLEKVKEPEPVWGEETERLRSKSLGVTYTKFWKITIDAKSLQSCPTLCDPMDGSPPGFPSLGFSRQEHWSGLPFPSPMHEREKWKGSRSVVSDSSRPHGLLSSWDFPGKSTGAGCHAFSKLWIDKCKSYTLELPTQN